MAIVNRTPDSFYDKGRAYELGAAMERVHDVVAAGADLVDIGGVKAAPGPDVPAVEEIRRTTELIAATRAAYPDLVISVDTFRHEVADAACEAGADLINDPWGGGDRKLLEVAADRGAALVCTHAGGLPPRTRPHRVPYADMMADILDRTLELAELAVAAGVERDRILVDPGHDFGKNTRHSLEATGRLGELVATGWPVLVSLSNKDFVGETLDLP
ncbi:MAG: dihydropteroate synthase, partial [Actinomycetota bacterium]|nr:dihydropteroate synthase [Actinomycetota bacterium]